MMTASGDPIEYFFFFRSVACRHNNGGCNHYCIPFNNQPQCLCRSGFRLDASLRHCIDIDECSSGIPAPCIPFACRNLRGSFECICTTGWMWTTGQPRCQPREYSIVLPMYRSSETVRSNYLIATIFGTGV